MTQPSPSKPDNVRYMTGWFLVKYKGDMKRARKDAAEYVQQHKRSD